MSRRNDITNRREFQQFADWVARMYPEISSEISKDSKSDKRKFICKTVTFQVTDACSLACTYCYQINKGKRVMSWEIAKAMVDNLLSGEKGFNDYLENPPFIILEFIGGEPFLQIDLIDKIVDYFRMRAIELNHPWADRYCLSICSNGVAYNDPRVQRFLDKNNEHLSLSITVDGTKELHDMCRVFPDGSPSYDLAHGAALDWMSKGHQLGSKITIAPANKHFFSACLKQMIADGYSDIQANCVYEKGWTLEDAQEIWRQCKEFSDWMRNSEYDQDDFQISFFDYITGFPLDENNNQNWCGGTGNMLSCDPDGKLFPCIRYMESSLGNDQKPIIIGDVWNGIMQTPEEIQTVKCLDCITRRTQSTDECFYCPIAQGCSWCSAYNYQVNGTVDKRCTYICDTHKARSFAITYYWNHYYYEKDRWDQVHDLWVPEQWAVPIVGQKEYDDLVELTLKMGGKVNKSETIIKDFDGRTSRGVIVSRLLEKE